MRSLELLSPARDADTGIEAIRHGADAVYIGGPAFGARAAAGNGIADIERLCRYAHIFNARVYVTLNTILYDEELPAAEALIHELYRCGVDALIVQDMALLTLNLPPIALHASTQTDNCTPEKAQWLEALGFRQIVLARECGIEQTRKIATAVNVPIEAFVHGALCVSYSGRCYASQHCFQRSANRGACAQFCRLSFDLIDEKGNTIVANKHLLSLRDMNRTDVLEEMAAAGVSSFKIEGRLKSADYVKNVTAWYRRKLDRIIAAHPDCYCRSSYGSSTPGFTPDVTKSFNRGFTDYFWHGRTAAPLHSFYSPKAIGAEAGRITRVGSRSFTVRLSNGQTPLRAGDGICFIDGNEQLQGFRVNRTEGNEVFPATMPRLTKGTTLFRNVDAAFQRTLSKPSPRRKLSVDITLRETPAGYAIDIADEAGRYATYHAEYAHETARSPQREQLAAQLSKLGETDFTARNVIINTAGDRFVPSSVVAEWRRAAVELLSRGIRLTHHRDLPGKADKARATELLPPTNAYTANVANRAAEGFYRSLGATTVAPAFELKAPEGEVVLMTCRHCLRHALGLCAKHPAPPTGLRASMANVQKNGRRPESLSLRLPDGRVFPLRFDCKRCEMQVLAPKG